MVQLRFKRKRCLTGQRHVWLLNAATVANPSGQLTGVGHLKGTCRHCGKSQTFHPTGQRHSFRRSERINLCQERRAA